MLRHKKGGLAFTSQRGKKKIVCPRYCCFPASPFSLLPLPLPQPPSRRHAYRVHMKVLAPVGVAIVLVLVGGGDASGICPGCNGDGCTSQTCDLRYACLDARCVLKCNDQTDCRGGESEYDNSIAKCKCNTCGGQGYDGSQCDQCAESYEMVNGACEVMCTVAKTCTGASHASDSEYVSSSKSCKCTCTNKWEGAACETCPSPFEGASCDQCQEGNINYPTCQKCTVATHCSNHGESATSASQTKCKCDCSAGYDGETCDACASGFTNYPTCKACSVAEACSGHASKAVTSADKTTCTCTCTAQWEGASCNSCPSKFEGSNCDECAGETVSYPTCTACSSAVHCNGHASSVKADATKKSCTCTCSGKWEGATCNTCPTGYDEGANCAACEDGYIGYPTCTKCTAATHCSGQATAVTSTNHKTCTCTCSNEFSGSDCSKCNSPYTGSSCNKCLGGFEKYPACTAICSSAKSCNGRAQSVKWISGTTCECTCSGKWEGATCNTCPTGYDEGANCAACEDGYIGYPTCTKCTAATHCSGQATAVTSTNHKTCTCTCSNEFSGSDCSKCNSPYTGSSCNQCLGGFEKYPACTAICSSAKSCNGRAKSVKWISGTTCECTCASKWEGATCNNCPSEFDQTTCNKCATGLVNYPTCEGCDNTKHCNGRADSVSASGNTCKCVCSNQWTGTTCNKCNSPFGGSDCKECLPGFTGYPTCGAACTSAYCTSHGAATWVKGDGSQPGDCTCKCSDSWEGATCNTCNPIYGSTCDGCAANHISYPTCTKCDMATHCSGRASAVESNAKRTACSCTCTNQWSGGDCSTCSSPFGGADCNECEGGLKGYPNCVSKCSIATSCSNQATTVKWDANTDKCVCTCKNNWTGDTCSDCLSPYGGADCDQCSAGFFGAKCVQCDTTLHCSNHASAVTSVAPFTDCSCTCTNQWSGGDCSTCSSPFGGADCNECEGGLKGYPNCVSKCSIATSCSNQATTVKWDANTDKCVCTCKNNWTGDTCSDCLSPYGGADCDQCSAGFFGAKCVQCDTTLHCSNHASAVTSAAPFTDCSCTCTNQWSGGDCSLCSSPFGGADCNECEGGLKGYPNCVSKCTLASCSNHASAVSWVQGDGSAPGDCDCTCSDMWNGTTCNSCEPIYDAPAGCNACAANHIVYPTCTECTTNVHCSSHAELVEADALQQTCECTCRNQWSGSDCGTCGVQYDGADCNACASGLMNYPLCTAACTIDNNCTSHATATEFDTQTASCNCTCSNQWTGDACDMCPGGYDATCSKCAVGMQGFPTCTAICTVDGSCSSHAESVAFADPGCTCACKNGYTGAACELCPTGYDGTKDCAVCSEGYAGYPDCMKCTVTDHCSSHGESVLADIPSNKCICTCVGHWSGETCDVCPAGYDGTNCNQCSAGNVPALEGTGECVPCTVDGYCGGHADAVEVMGDQCVCSCRNRWEGAGCATCPPTYKGDDCDQCRSEGQYPGCNDPCDVARDCNNRGVSVSGDRTLERCQCTCSNYFSRYVPNPYPSPSPSLHITTPQLRRMPHLPAPLCRGGVRHMPRNRGRDSTRLRDVQLAVLQLQRGG